MAKKVSEGREKPDERRFHVKDGHKIEFPVPAKHPFARFQTLTPVRSVDDVYEFLALWERVAAAREQPPPDSLALVAQMKKAKLHVLRLATNDLRIESGAVVTLSNPLNQLDFDTITIAGDLVARGELVVRCNTLTIE